MAKAVPCLLSAPLPLPIQKIQFFRQGKRIYGHLLSHNKLWSLICINKKFLHEFISQLYLQKINKSKLNLKLGGGHLFFQQNSKGFPHNDLLSISMYFTNNRTLSPYTSDFSHQYVLQYLFTTWLLPLLNSLRDSKLF